MQTLHLQKLLKLPAAINRLNSGADLTWLRHCELIQKHNSRSAVGIQMRALLMTLAIIASSSLALGQSATQRQSPQWLAAMEISDLNADTLPQSPYNLYLIGSTKTDLDRDKISKFAIYKFPFFVITDKTNVTTEGIDADTANILLDALSKLKVGQISFNNGIVHLRAEEGRFDTSLAQLGLQLQAKSKYIQSVTIETIPNRSRSDIWIAEKRDQTLILKGFLPNQTAQKKIQDIVRADFGSLKISDLTQIKALNASSASSDDWTASAIVGLSQLKQSGDGAAIISGDTYRFSAQSSNTSASTIDLSAAYAAAALKNLPNAVKTSDILVVPTSTSTTPLKQEEASRRLRVFYATDREPIIGIDSIDYGSKRSETIEYGSAIVRIPENHTIGNIELPSTGLTLFGMSLTSPTQSDPKEHFILQSIDHYTEESWGSVARSLNKSDEALVFVHGYNTSFRASILRMAQLTWDLQFKGIPIVFSWPSDGRLLSYEYDRNSALVARRHLIQILRYLRDDMKIQKVHVLAHSMGNFLMLDALDNYSQINPQIGLQQIIMAAPDIDIDQFRQNISAVRSLASGFTLYASSADKALVVSRTLAGNRRAGDVVNGDVVIAPGVDTIDATSVGDDILGLDHGYYANKRSILSDIKRLLSGERPPDQRLPEIRPVPEGSNSPSHWKFAQ